MTHNSDNIKSGDLMQKPLRLGIIYEEESRRGLTHPFFYPDYRCIQTKGGRIGM